MGCGHRVGGCDNWVTAVAHGRGEGWGEGNQVGNDELQRVAAAMEMAVSANGVVSSWWLGLGLGSGLGFELGFGFGFGLGLGIGLGLGLGLRRTRRGRRERREK